MRGKARRSGGKGEKREERARGMYTGNGAALPQGRTPNLGHNYMEDDVAPLFSLYVTGAAVTYILSLSK